MLTIHRMQNCIVHMVKIIHFISPVWNWTLPESLLRGVFSLGKLKNRTGGMRQDSLEKQGIRWGGWPRHTGIFNHIEPKTCLTSNNTRNLEGLLRPTFSFAKKTRNSGEAGRQQRHNLAFKSQGRRDHGLIENLFQITTLKLGKTARHWPRPAASDSAT